MTTNVVIPIIDMTKFINGSGEERREVARLIGQAARDVGFFTVIGHQVDTCLIDKTWSATRGFFDLPIEEKMEFVTEQDTNPFGYSRFGEEVLSAGKDVETHTSQSDAPKPDLKEMYSLGPADPEAGFPPRNFPPCPLEFESATTDYYEAVNKLGCHILRAMAIALELPDENFFEKFVTHHASAMRALNYPSVTADQVLPGQLRASAHTDYGTITILRSDGPGLQVSKDKSPPTWCDVPHIEGAFIVNLGDLMRRWTNDEWLSTLHRVIVPSFESDSSQWIDVIDGVKATKRRQSIAFFHNLNRDAVVEVLLKKEGDVPKHEPIIAGKFLMEKHLASISAFSS